MGQQKRNDSFLNIKSIFCALYKHSFRVEKIDVLKKYSFLKQIQPTF